MVEKSHSNVKYANPVLPQSMACLIIPLLFMKLRSHIYVKSVIRALKLKWVLKGMLKMLIEKKNKFE